MLFSNSDDEIAAFEATAIGDDYNTYYIAQGDLLKSVAAKESVVKIIRPFAEPAVYTGKYDSIGSWISKNSRPSLLPFDQRTIQSIFGESKKAFIFVNTGSEESLLLKEKVVALANAHEGDIVFTEIEKSNEHFDRFADYIKVSVDTPKVLVVDGGKQKKYVQSGRVTI